MTPSGCGTCRKNVIRARMDGKPVSVVRVVFGKGTIALTPALIGGGAPSASRPGNRTGYELHSCPGLKSFTKFAPRRDVVR